MTTEYVVMKRYEAHVPPLHLNTIIKELRGIPIRYLGDHGNCNSANDLYMRGEIEQLKPSTHPVFLFRRFHVVVKVMRDLDGGRNEEEARRRLWQEIPFIPAQIVRESNRILVIMQEIPGAVMLSEISEKNFPVFYEQYKRVLNLIGGYITRHKSEEQEKLNKIVFGGRSKKCLYSWLNKIGEECNDMSIFSHKTRRKYIIKDEVHNALLELSKPAKECCLFLGDTNLHNILSTDEGPCLIDFEYWGYFDVDYIFSNIIGSYFAHCSVINEDCFVNVQSGYSVQYSLRREVEELFQARGHIFHLKESKLNFNRIRAFILARWFYRIIGILRNGDKRDLYYLTYLLDSFREMVVERKDNNK